MALDMTGVKLYEVGEEIAEILNDIDDFQDDRKKLFGQKVNYRYTPPRVTTEGRVVIGFARPEDIAPAQFPCAFIWNGEGDKTGDSKEMSEYSECDGFVIVYFHEAKAEEAYKKLLLIERIVDKAINLKRRWNDPLVTIRTSGISVAPNLLSKFGDDVPLKPPFYGARVDYKINIARANL